MAYLDEKTQKFLDNIINGASNEELYKMQRAPAGKPFVGPPTAAQDIPVVEAQNVQPNTEVEAPARVRPLEISGPALVKQTPDYMENTNRSIEGVANLKNQYINERQLAQDEADKNKANLAGAYALLNKSFVPRVRTPEENARLQSAQESLKNIKDIPERDLLSEAILSFGPALLGGLTGESGALAAPAASKQARDLYEAGRKQDIESINKRNEQIRKNYENILKIDKQAAEDYLNNQKLQLQQADTGFKGASLIAGATDKQLQSIDQKITDLQKAESAATQKGAETVLNAEMTPAKEAAKTKRAGIIAKGQELKDATKLRDEFNNDPIVKNFKLIEEANQKIQDASDNPIGHLSMITGYAKIIDPGNAVKEGEFRNVKEARAFFTKAEKNGIPVPSFVMEAINQLEGKGSLLPQQISQLKRESRVLRNSQQKLAAGVEERLSGIAKDYGVRENLVVPNRSQPVMVDISARQEKLDALLKAKKITQQQYDKFIKGGK